MCSRPGFLAERDAEVGGRYVAITEQATWIEPGATVREAVQALVQPGVTHPLVAHRPDTMPEGVVSEVDLLALGRR